MARQTSALALALLPPGKNWEQNSVFLGHWLFRIEIGAKLINQIRRAAFASPPLLWPTTVFSRPPKLIGSSTTYRVALGPG